MSNKTMKSRNFWGIPMMEKSRGSLTTCGPNSYMTKVEDTDKQDYLNYLLLLEEYGFVKHSDNGEGLGETVFTTSCLKDKTAVTVSYLSKKRQTVIMVTQDVPLSEHLLNKQSYQEGVLPEAKTKLYMLEMWHFGNSFVFQLKNGHFIISDGGTEHELPYLLDFLESLVPEGEKPVVEAWIITHSHPDHYGVLVGFLPHLEWLSRIYLEGIYYNEPNEQVIASCESDLCHSRMRWVASHGKNVNREAAKLYRPQIGQRYYFCGLTMDVIFTQDVVPFEDFHADINNASTVCIFNVEGQKLFFSGDIHEEGFLDMMEIYSRDYLKSDFFTLNHHGHNTCTVFTDYVSIQTLLVTRKDFVTPARTRREMHHVYENVQEAYHWGQGTKVITFPYEVGSAETLEKFDWIYHNGETARSGNRAHYAVPGHRFRGFIFEADEVLFVDEKVQDGALELLQHIKNHPVYTSVYSVKWSTDELQDLLEKAELTSYFDLVLGRDALLAQDENLISYKQDENILRNVGEVQGGMSEAEGDADLYRVALLKSEKVFDLEHVHNILVICHDMQTGNVAIEEGFGFLAVNSEVTAELKMKARDVVGSLKDVFKFFDKIQIKFDVLKSYLRKR